MNSYTISFKKIAFAFLAAVVTLAVFATPAAAATYYYPPVTVPYYQVYQPPVYQYQAQNTAQLIAYLQSLLKQLEALQKQYESQYGHSYGGGTWQGGDYDIDVETLYARDVEDDEATLYGELDLDDASYADVWFEYGEGGDLDEESDEKRVTSSQDERFHIDIDGLDDDEHYYFRAVAEAPNGDRVYGQIKSFSADDSNDDDDDDDNDNDDDRPTAETGDATDIEDDSARMEGEVDMNDFSDGHAFFVYGEDEDLVEDVENEDSYSDIDEEGDDLQKHSVNTNLDDYRSFWIEVFGLDDSTDYYFRICVEYEDEDDDETLECGDVEHFETD